MFVRAAAIAAAVTVAFACAGVASADPGNGTMSCSYTMSDPHVVDVSGTTMVAATLTPSGCSGTAKPISSQVCVSTTGTSRCAELPGYTTAHAYLSPYIPGATYTATGRGCASVPTPYPQPLCSSLGPRSVTL
jgi:hypothetical protein